MHSIPDQRIFSGFGSVIGNLIKISFWDMFLEIQNNNELILEERKPEWIPLALILTILSDQYQSVIGIFSTEKNQDLM